LPGWDEFYVRTGFDVYFNWRETQNGVLVDYGSDPEDYSTDVWAAQAESFLQSANSDVEPSFLYFAPVAGHLPFHAAPRHEGALEGVAPNRPPSFNVPPDDLNRASLSPDEVARTDFLRQRHLETLLAADEAVERLFNALSESGELDNTVIVFTTDHGFLFGEHAATMRKHDYYEEAIRVPLVVWDGRAPAARINDNLVLNIDLAPTLAELGGARVPSPVDGRSLTAAIHGDPAPVRSDFLFEDWFTTIHAENPWFTEGQGNSAAGIRTTRWKYAEHDNGRIVLIDLQNDPYELVNLAGKPALAAVQQHLANRLNQLRGSDREGPAIVDVTSSVERDGKDIPFVRLYGQVDDGATGGSEARSPSFYIDDFDFRYDGAGETIDAVDGKFDSVRESFRGRVYPHHIAELTTGGAHSILIRGRDTPGNWGATHAVPLVLRASPRLAAQSDTGGSSTDGVTADDTPTFSGIAAPGAQIELFGAWGTTWSLGTTMADAQGRWSITPDLSPGSYRILALVTDAQGSRFTAARHVYVAAEMDDAGKLFVVGTLGNDVILFDASQGSGSASLRVNSILVGTFPLPDRVFVNALGGDDRVTVLGAVRAHLSGRRGDDILIGGSGDDVLDGGTGRNVLRGNAGNDTYRAFTEILKSIDPADPVVDELWELPGQGVDTLEFTQIDDPITFNADRSILIEYNGRSPITWQRRMTVGNGNAASFERLRLGSGSDTLIAPLSLRVDDVGGHATIQSNTYVEPGDSVAVRLLAIGSGLLAQDYRLVLDTSLGELEIPTNVAGGVTVGQVAGNNSNHVEITASSAQLLRTLAVSGLTFRTEAGVFASAAITAWIFTEEGELVERDDLRIPVSVPPTVRLGASSKTVVEGRAPQPLFPTAALAAIENQLAEGRLTIALERRYDSIDRLLILPQGSGPGQIDVAGDTVLFSQQVLGQIVADGTAGRLLEIRLAAAATREGVERLLRRLAFVNDSEAPSDVPRIIIVRLFDTWGAARLPLRFTVNMQPVNDRPAIQLGGVAVYQEESDPIDLAPEALVNDLDSSDMAGGQLRVTIVSGATSSDRLTIHHQGMDPNQVGVEGNQVFFSGMLVGTAAGGIGGNPLVLSLNENSTLIAVQAVLRRVAYSTVGEILVRGARTVRFTLSDGDGGTSNAGQVSVDLVPRNDPPAIVDLGGTITFRENGAAVAVAASARIIDPDSANFAAGKLTVRLIGSQPGDLLSIRTTANITTTDGKVLFAGQVIGTVSGGSGSVPLRVTFNSLATPAKAQAVLRNVVFQNGSENPSPAPRRLNAWLSDGDGGISAVVEKQIQVIPDNDTAMNTALQRQIRQR